MSIHDTKLIVFFAYASQGEVVCTYGAGCVITGSQGFMEAYSKELDPQNKTKRTIRKTRFGEIMQGMQLGTQPTHLMKMLIIDFILSLEK